VWQRTQSEARSREEHELGTITLRLLSLIRQGREATLDLACVEAFGFHFNVWRQKSLARQSHMAWEFAALVPDYDPSVESERSLRRPTAGKGALYPLPEPKIPALQESVLQMPLPRTGTK
jgi:hypothetical protein